MLAGATLADPARIDVRGEVSVGRDVFIDANVLLEGKVTLGDRVRVGPNVVLRDVAIGADSVDSSEFACSSRASSAPAASSGRTRACGRARSSAPNVHIGNFVELKKTEIADGSKANHLTYLGDAIIGKGVNVGAGTITCNYDGVNKSTTTIEDGAFIGSGNMLVAPVRIGKDATTGAGSTITKDAPDGQLTLSRAQADDSRRLEAAGEETQGLKYGQRWFAVMRHADSRADAVAVVTCRSREAASPTRIAVPTIRGDDRAQPATAWCWCSIGYRKVWELPGGLIDAGESPREAARRDCSKKPVAAARDFHWLGLVEVNDGATHFGAVFRLRSRRCTRGFQNDEIAGIAYWRRGAAPAPLGETDAALLDRFG